MKFAATILAVAIASSVAAGPIKPQSKLLGAQANFGQATATLAAYQAAASTATSTAVTPPAKDWTVGKGW